MDNKRNEIVYNEKKPTELLTADFYYDLPPELIAQHPSEKRDESRLMVIDRKSGQVTHRVFKDIIDYLECGDVLVINDSKVIPARLLGKKEDTGIDMEVLLLREREADVWECLTRPGRRAKEGTSIIFGGGVLRATVTGVLDNGNRTVRLEYDRERYNINTVLDEVGTMPLPPYITESLSDKDRYQTVYANESGSAAAPTAGLHFTEELLRRIEEKGVKVVRVMLHVGLGTFRPVKAERLDEHEMHTEYFCVSEESADTINAARAAGGRVICVGTTSCRTLESAADDDGTVRSMSADTGIFIYPGYRFKAVDALITNFHLPESTLLMLVSAFSSREIMLSAYEEAVREGYRFFSFGDAMLIL